MDERTERSVVVRMDERTESRRKVAQCGRAPPPGVPPNGEWESRCCGLSAVYVAQDGRRYTTAGVEVVGTSPDAGAE